MSSTAAVTGIRPEVHTFLPPIDKPKGLMMKLAYYFTRRQFGKVLTPLKVHSARLPSAFGMFYSKVAQLDKKLVLPLETVLLIREQVHHDLLRAQGELELLRNLTAQRLQVVDQWIVLF